MLCSSTHLTRLFQVNHKPLQSSVPTPPTRGKEKKKNTHQSPPTYQTTLSSSIYVPAISTEPFSNAALTVFYCRKQSREEILSELKVTRGTNWFLFFFPSADNCNFLPSDQIGATGRCPGNNQTAQIAQAVVEKMSLSVCRTVSDSFSVISLQLLN